MDLSDKTKVLKDSGFKLKPRKLLLGKVKHVHGRWQHPVEMQRQNSIKPDTTRTPENTPSTFRNCFSQQTFPQPTKNVSHLPLFTQLATPNQGYDPSGNHEPSNPRLSFEDHVEKWAQDFGKLLVLPSRNCEFDMPYCYSQEFYRKLSAHNPN